MNLIRANRAFAVMVQTLRPISSVSSPTLPIWLGDIASGRLVFRRISDPRHRLCCCCPCRSSRSPYQNLSPLIFCITDISFLLPSQAPSLLFLSFWYFLKVSGFLQNDRSPTHGVRSKSKSQCRIPLPISRQSESREMDNPFQKAFESPPFPETNNPKKDPCHHRPRAGKISFASATRLSRRFAEANLPRIPFSSRLKVRNRFLVSSRTRGFPRLHLSSRRASYRLRRAGVPRLLVVWLYRQYSLHPECFLTDNTVCNNCAKRLHFVQANNINRDLALTYSWKGGKSDLFRKFWIKIIGGEDH
jgi:hypothetical protein